MMALLEARTRDDKTKSSPLATQYFFRTKTNILTGQGIQPPRIRAAGASSSVCTCCMGLLSAETVMACT